MKEKIPSPLTTVELDKSKNGKALEKVLRAYGVACGNRNEQKRVADDQKDFVLAKFPDSELVTFTIKGRVVAQLCQDLWSGTDVDKLRTEFPEAYEATRVTKPYKKLTTSF